MKVRKFDNRADYVFFTDYDVLLFNSISALSHGGAFDAKVISDKPFTCELRNAEDNQLFGVFSLSLLDGGKVNISFENRKSGAAAWADFMRKELDKEPAPIKDNLRTAIKSYFHALRGLGIDLHKRPALIVDAAKIETPKTHEGKKKKLKLPSRYGDAEKWVLAWEVLESLIDNDLTLKIDYDELRPKLKAQGLNFRGDKTLKDIIALGRKHRIPSLLEFEQKHKK